MENITLSENHNRAISSSMYLIEKLIDELENELFHVDEKIMKKIVIENENLNFKHYTLIFKELKNYIKYIENKYNLQPSSYNLSQVIASKKSKMWEILEDTKSKKLNGFGKFPIEYSQELDSDIEKLLKLTDNI